MTYLERNSVKITDGFWNQKRELNRKTTINAVWDRFYDTGRINAFKFDWKEGMDNKPHIPNCVLLSSYQSYFLFEHEVLHVQKSVLL